jgi:hypothetical protein
MSIVISPVGSVDSTSCSIMLNAYIDQTLFNNNKLLQIEFNIFQLDMINDSTGISGFITQENGLSTVGVLNNINITIPCLEGVSIDYTGNTCVRVRGYFGNTQDSGIIVTTFSNSVGFYNAPSQPEIHKAILSSSSNDVIIDTLTLIIEPNSDYFYQSILKPEFTITYNFRDDNDQMQWIVSDLTSGIFVNFENSDMIVLNSISFPTTANLTHPVNVSVIAVYQYTHETSTFFSVSHMSNPENAVVDEEGSSTLNQPFYEIYMDMSSQKIDLSWNAPASGPIDPPSLYALCVAVNDNTPYVIYDTSNSNLLHYTWNLPLNLYDTSLSSVLKFFVDTIYDLDTSGQSSYISNDISLNTFAYPTEPINLNVFADSLLSSFNLAVTFENPEFIGQGQDKKLYCKVLDSSNAQIENVYLPYSSSTLSYDFSFNFPSNDQPLAGTVEVYMETDNTNPIPEGPLSGPYVSQTYNIPTIEQPYYEIYDENHIQVIDLSWNIYNDLSGTFTSNFDRYELYVDISGVNIDISGGLIATITDVDNTAYSWNILQNYSDLVNTTQSSELNFIVKYVTTEDTFFTSNVVNINTFAYPTEPINLNVFAESNLSSSSSFNLAVTFENPEFIGQGQDKKLYCKVLDSSNAQIENVYLPYSSSTLSYDFSFNFSSNDQPLAGTVEVYMETDNTNPIPTGPLSGPYVSQTYNIPTIEQPYYEIYDENHRQVIDLSWNIYNDLSGTFTSNFDRYELYVDISGVDIDISGGLIATITDVDNTAYSWNILQNYSDLVNTTQSSELNFIVKYFTTEDTFFTSNVVNINTFAYPTPVRNLEYRYAYINDNNSVSISFSFKNPIFPGQGAPVIFHYTISDPNGGNEVTDTVTYVPGQQLPYIVHTTCNILDGIITVYLETDNTNLIPASLSGPSNSISYIATSLPVVESIKKNVDNSVTVVVSTSNELGLNNQIGFTRQGVTNLLSYLSFNTTSSENVNVTENYLLNGVIEYVFIFDSDFFPFVLNSNLSATVSNSNGISVKSTVVSTTNYPWGGGEINSFWYWEGNYASSSGSSAPLTNQGWYTGVSSSQPPDLSTSNLISTTSGTFTYYGSNSSTFVFPEGLNSIMLFIGFSNANLSLGQYYAYNYTMNTQMLNDTYNYFGISDISDAENRYLIAMSVGGGNSYTGGWTTGVPTASVNNPYDNPSVGGIYSMYQQCTPEGVSFTYTEYGTGTAVTQTGTGVCSGYTNLTQGPTGNGVNASGLYSLTQFNCLAFDIEDGSSVNGYSTSTAQDFLNLFEYIKTNPNSVFYSTGVTIIVTISHSCSENIGSSVIAPLLSANPCYYDYISPQLYTCNVGTTNEYCANNQIPWSPAWSSESTSETFTSLLEQNSTYSTYGLNMIIPSINYANIYNSAGSNPYPYYPNLYWYETDYSIQNAPPAPTTDSVSAGTINYSVDTGAVGFFQEMFNSSSSLGGYIEWVNGTSTS